DLVLMSAWVWGNRATVDPHGDGDLTPFCSKVRSNRVASFGGLSKTTIAASKVGEAVKWQLQAGLLGGGVGRPKVGPGELLPGPVTWRTVGSTASLDLVAHLHSLGRLHGGCGGYACVSSSTIDLHLCFFLSRRIEVPRIADFTNPSAGSVMWQAFRSKMGQFGHFIRPGGSGLESSGLTHLPVL
ncbi:hypothetical protein U9M48_039567, partial [Paspalum notatum var. saurae]